MRREMTMKPKTLLSLLVAVLLGTAGIAAAAGPAQDAPAQVGGASADKLTLEACLQRALERNLDLRITVLEPRRAEAGVTLAGERFLPPLSFNAGSQSTREASYSYLSGSGNLTSRYDDYGTALTETIPTGGTLTASLASYKSDSNSSFQTINPRYGSQLTFSFSQPLLRDFGYRIPRRQILVAQYNRDRSEMSARRAVLDTLYTVESAYWELVYAIEDLKVKRQSVELARALLQRSRHQVEIGTLAPIEVLTAEAEAASREADIHQAEALVKNREATLRTLLDLRTPASETPLPIEPADAPAAEARSVSLDGAVAAALDKRPEILSARIGLRSSDLELTYARNQLLPALSLDLSYWSPGISGTQILYQDDNPLTGVVIGTIAGQAATARKDAAHFKCQNWSGGRTRAVPLSSLLTRAAAVQAGLDVEQARLVLERAEQSVILDVRTAFREVETNAKRIASYEAARRLSERKLEGEERKAKVGMSMNYTILQFQRDLTKARSQEIRARIDYVISQAKLDQAMGASLERRNIVWTSPLQK